MDGERPPEAGAGVKTGAAAGASAVAAVVASPAAGTASAASSAAVMASKRSRPVPYPTGTASRPEIFRPLYSEGLCEAVIITPASKP